MPIYATIIGLVMGTLFWVVNGFPFLNQRDTFIVILTGVLTIWSSALYFRATASEEASRIIFLFQATPVLTFILSFIFLKEIITLKQCLGFVLILGSVLGVSAEKTSGKVRLSSSFFLILIVDLVWAVSAVLIKFAISANSFSKILSYESWGIGIGGVILCFLFPSVQKAFNESIRSVRKVAWGVMFFNEAVFIVGKALTFFAYSIGPTALVSIIGSTQVFFGILYGLVLTAIAPGVFKEGIDKIHLVKKAGAAVLLLVGIWLIYWSSA